MTRLIATGAISLLAAAAVFTPAAPAGAAAQDTEYSWIPDGDNLAELHNARTLRCDLDGIIGGTVFDSIDYSTNSARLIGGAGAADVLALQGMRDVSFIERTPMGTINLTTVWGWKQYGDYGDFHAVTSRHSGTNGPTPSQGRGTCKVLLQ